MLEHARHRARFVDKPITTVYQAYKRQPNHVAAAPADTHLPGGKIYTWVVDERYVYNEPTGSSRYGPTITYHYQQRVGGHFVGYHYLTDGDDIVRDVKIRNLGR